MSVSSQGSSSYRRNREAYPLWYFNITNYELLDKDDAPMVATLKVKGEITDYVETGLGFKIAQKETKKAILSVLKRHCREHISCLKFNKVDPKHDYAKDKVDGGSSRGMHLMKASRSLLRSIGRTVLDYDLISLTPAPIHWTGNVRQYIGGYWVFRSLNIDQDGKLTLTTIEADGSEDAHWKCHYCLGMNKGLIFACEACGSRRPKPKKDISGNSSTKTENTSTIGNITKYDLGAKNLCAVQEVDYIYGRDHVIVVTLNKLPNGTVLNSGAQHRGPNLIRSNNKKDENEHNDLDPHDDASTVRGVTFKLIFCCHNEEMQHELTAALKNSSSTVLPTLWRAAQRLDIVTLRLLIEKFGVDANRENSYGNTPILLAVRHAHFHYANI